MKVQLIEPHLLDQYLTVLQELDEECFPSPLRTRTWKDVQWWALVEEATTSGFAGAKLLSKDEVRLVKSCCRPSVRGNGLQKKLLSACIGWAMLNGARYVSVFVVASSEGAIKNFESLGFVRQEAPRDQHGRVVRLGGAPALYYVLDLVKHED